MKNKTSIFKGFFKASRASSAILGCWLLIFFFLQVHARAPLVKGAEIQQLGRTLTAFSLGGASLGESIGADMLGDDVTAAARILRQNASFQMLGIQAESSLLGLGYIIPTSYGVFGVDISSHVPIGPQITNEVGYFFTLSGSFSKRISRFIDFGFRLSIDYALPNPIDVAEDSDDRREEDRLEKVRIPAGVNVDIGVSFLSETDIVKRGFSVRNVRYGFMIRNAGLVPFYSSATGKDLFVKTIDIFNMGLGFDFISVGKLRDPYTRETGESKGFVSRLVLEAGLNYPINFHIEGGIRNSMYTGLQSFPEFSFTIGSFYNPLVKEIFPLSTGLGFHFRADDVDITLRALAALLKPEESYDVTGFWVGVNIAIRFGYRDLSAPDIQNSKLEGEGEIPFSDEILEP